MRYFFVLFLLLSACSIQAQVNPSKIYGTWVKCKATYSDGVGLPDDHVMKYTYFKYKFEHSGKAQATVSYFEFNAPMLFEINYGMLVFKSPEGGMINSFKIEAIKDTLILVQYGRDGAYDPNSVKLYFIPERVYQNSIVLKPEDVYAVKGADTVFKQNAKIYAQFNEDSFQRYIYDGIRDKISMDGRAGYFSAGFIVSKQGVADSLKIYEDIDEGFKKQFVKVFNKAKGKWKAATLNGKPVAVYTTISLGYSTSETMLPAYLSAQKGNEAYNDKDYDLAIYYYDKALKNVPTDKTNLYKRGMCKWYMGNSAGACEDWNKIKALGSDDTTNALIDKYCK